MITFMTVMALSVNCPDVRLINFADGMNEQDTEALHVAGKRCGTYYGAEAPCLKVFSKQEQGVYRAVCGKGINK